MKAHQTSANCFRSLWPMLISLAALAMEHVINPESSSIILTAIIMMSSFGVGLIFGPLYCIIHHAKISCGWIAHAIIIISECFLLANVWALLRAMMYWSEFTDFPNLAGAFAATAATNFISTITDRFIDVVLQQTRSNQTSPETTKDVQ